MRLKLKTSFFVLILFCLSTSIADAFYFSDNFDSYTTIGDARQNWDYVPSAAVLDTTGGYGGSKAIKFVYVGEQYYPLEKMMSSAGLDHVYARFKFKVGPNPVGGVKFFKIFGVSSNANYANWTWNFGSMTKTPAPLTPLCWGEGGGLANDTNVCAYPSGEINGPAGTITLLEHSGTNFLPTAGQWYEVTTYNRYSTNGHSDGEMWMAINGTKILHVVNMKNRNDANVRAIERIHFADYSNPSANMTIWYDSIEISDSPFSGTPVVTPPTGAKIMSFTP